MTLTAAEMTACQRVGRRIRAARRAAGMTQEELGSVSALEHYADPVSEVDRRSARLSRIADYQIRIPERLTADLADMRSTRPQSSAAWAGPFARVWRDSVARRAANQETAAKSSKKRSRPRQRINAGSRTLAADTM